MNYQRALEYMYSQLPMFQRVGAAAYKANLDNTIALCDLLNNPQKKFKTIHIAGTNGKGSTSHLLASILQNSGLKVGLYTSPHLKDFRERIKINGKKIDKQFVCHFIEKHQAKFNKMNPSFFEMTVGLAFDYFAKKNIDIAVIETGLGGRLDSTNIVHPILSIITNIGLDHTQFLGTTLKEIAYEKAGIIKPKTPIVIGETQTSIKQIFISKATKEKAPITFADNQYKAKITKTKYGAPPYQLIDVFEKKGLCFHHLKLPLLGHYQQKNIVTALRSIDALRSLGYPIQKKHITKGIKDVIKNTGLMGRWQVLGTSPIIVCDTGHNVDGIKAVVKQIKTIPYKKLHLVFGMVNDKDCEGILKLLPKNATYYFCKANIPRGLDAEVLQLKAKKHKLKGDAYLSVKKAIQIARKNALKNDFIFIGGSTFIVAEAL